MGVKVSNRELPLARGSAPTGEGRSGRGRSTVKQQGEVRIDMDAEISPDDLRSWEGVQIPYENLAGNEEVAERARNYITKVVKDFQDEQLDTHEKWLLIRRLMDGMRGDEGEGEVPELYKAMERMIPRIEEQVIQGEEWFQAHGRDGGDKEQVQNITNFMNYQLEEDRFRHKIQPAARTMLAYGFCAMKTYWHIETERRIVRKHRIEKKEGRDVQFTSLREEEKVVYNGPRADLIDPFDFIVDIESTDIRDCRFVGDIRKMTLEEIYELEDRGVFTNTQDLETDTPVGRMDYASWFKDERDHSGRLGINRPETSNHGGPKSFYVVELWGPFDLFGTGRTRECVITLVNFRTVVRVQENPYDDKHRPYAIARANRDAFDFFSIGPFDNAIRPQLEMNRHRQLALRSHEQSLSPFIQVPTNADLPDSITDVEPGTFLFVDGPMTQFQTKSTMGEARYSDQILASDIEEITGSTRMLSGTEDSGTATESMNKMQESSRRLRAYIQSLTLCFNDMLEQWHALNAQYVTRPMKFRVLGKQAKGLDVYSTVDAEILQTRLDFTFTAFASLHSGDLIASQLMQWLNLVAPIAAKYPGRVNELEVLRRLYTHMADSVDIDQIVSLPKSPKDLLDQNDENIMLAQGQRVEISDEDDHRRHIEAMEDLWGYELSELSYSKLALQSQRNIMEHYMAHVDAMRHAANAQRIASAATPFAQPAEQLDGNRGTTGNQKQPGDENGFYNKQGDIFGGVGSQMGQTNGMPNTGQVPAADRNMGFFQNQQSMQ